MVVPVVTLESGTKAYVNWGNEATRFPPQQSKENGVVTMSVDQFIHARADENSRTISQEGHTHFVCVHPKGEVGSLVKVPESPHQIRHCGPPFEMSKGEQP